MSHASGWQSAIERTRIHTRSSCTTHVLNGGVTDLWCVELGQRSSAYLPHVFFIHKFLPCAHTYKSMPQIYSCWVIIQKNASKPLSYSNAWTKFPTGKPCLHSSFTDWSWLHALILTSGRCSTEPFSNQLQRHVTAEGLKERQVPCLHDDRAIVLDWLAWMFSAVFIKPSFIVLCRCWRTMHVKLQGK